MNLEELFMYVCAVMQEEPKNVKSKLRTPEYVFVRQMFAYVANMFYGYKKSSIGRFFNSDHTTQIHSIKCIQDLLDINDKTATSILEKIRQVLNIDFDKQYSTRLYEDKYNKLFKAYSKQKIELQDAKFEIKRLQIENKKLKVLYA